MVQPVKIKNFERRNTYTVNFKKLTLLKKYETNKLRVTQIIQFKLYELKS